MNLNLLLFLIHVFEKDSMEEIFVNQFVCLSTRQDKVMSSGPEILACFLDWRKRDPQEHGFCYNELIRIKRHLSFHIAVGMTVDPAVRMKTWLTFVWTNPVSPTSSSLANPNHAWDAYRSLDKMVDWKRTCRHSCGRPCDFRIFIAYKAWPQEVMTLSTWVFIEKLWDSVTPRVFISDFRVMPIGVGGGSLVCLDLDCGHACAFGRVDEAVSGGKPPAGKGVVGLLSWHGSHFWVCITICKVRHGDSVTKPDY